MLKQSGRAILAVALAIGSVRVAAQPITVGQGCSVPDWATAAMMRSAFGERFRLDSRLNPSCLRGDFDGDGKPDFAILVKDRRSGKRGIAIVHRRDGQVLVVGAGRDLSNGGDDWAWMDAWAVFEKARVETGATSARRPVLKGDALLVSKAEAASAIVWWDGTRYRWTQQGD